MNRSPEKQIASESVADVATEEMIKRLFAPDVTALAAYQSVSRRRARSAEAELVAALLDNGIADFQRFIFARDRKSARRFAEAESWIVSDDSDWLFSFANCCAVLGIDAGYLRKGLLAWQRAQCASTIASLGPRKRNIFRQAA